MLVLKNIKKEYITGDTSVMALKGVDIAFRKNEFVSVLGPSGCGKTTLLNIIGGLDHYSDGDLVINGISTKEYKDADWDTYRNHSVGFVFQNYNLIPHQTVLSNVELAMTLTGVSKAERRKRATEALERVGLGDQLKKKPTQMSGGQMQRVAIARALVNNPDILLADEPTGALDTETSVQIMDILKEVASDRLVIMVTHNPELAETYSTRIVRLLDGNVIGDTAPFDPETEKEAAEKPKRLPSMSLFTALSLSLNNLMTKKGRTILTAFAGSIGIIGIALILSMSNGIQNYIDRVQEDTLSSYPITIQSEEYDMSSVLTTIADNSSGEADHELDAVYSDTSMAELFDAMASIETKENDLKAFNKFITEENAEAEDYISTIKYTYDIQPQIFSLTARDSLYRVNPSSVFDEIYSGLQSGMSGGMGSMMSTSNNLAVWTELLDNKELLDSQYEMLAGKWPENFYEVVLVVDEKNEISELFMYILGLKNPDEVDDSFSTVMSGEVLESEQVRYTYDDILNMSYKLILPTDYYKKDTDGTWKDMRDNETYMDLIVNNGVDLKIVGIVRPQPDAVSTAISGAVGYTHAMTEYVINGVNNSEIVKEQKENTGKDVLTGLPFESAEMPELSDADKAKEFKANAENLSEAEKAAIYQEIALKPDEKVIAEQVEATMASLDKDTMKQMLMQGMQEQAQLDADTVATYLEKMSDEEIVQYTRTAVESQITEQYTTEVTSKLEGHGDDEKAYMFDQTLENADETACAALYDAYMPTGVSESTYEENMAAFGLTSLDDPTTISIYASSFEAKDELVRIISEYNDKLSAEGKEEEVISYTDFVGLLMSSVTKIINVISYVLIGFVSVSLVVSSIMIGIITYISVLERTKEIGILRSIGASKKDVSRVFTAETIIIGFVSGFLGILVTVLLNIPISVIVKALTDVPHIATLPGAGGIILVAISIFLTFIAGLIPARLAAKKDPVEALRTE